MGVLGKIVGGVAGFMIGGPIGALIGAFAGHRLLDRSTGGKGGESGLPDQAVFAAGVIALAAKLAKADGVVRETEIRVLHTVFPPGEVDQASVAALYNEAKQSAEGFEEYAEQLYTVFRRRPAVLVQVLEILFAVALADGKLNAQEEAFLHRVAAIFRFPPQLVEMVRKRHEFAGTNAGRDVPTEADNLTILGLTPEATNAEIKTRYRQLVRENHPDRLVAQGMAEDFVARATERLKDINAAYDRLSTQRGL